MKSMIDNKTIGRNISKVRKHKEMKAMEIAKHLGISESAYTKYERGETEITLSFIQKVCEYLDVDPITIFEATPDSVIERVYASTIAIQTNSTFSTIDENIVSHLMAMTSTLNE